MTDSAVACPNASHTEPSIRRRNNNRMIHVSVILTRNHMHTYPQGLAFHTIIGQRMNLQILAPLEALWTVRYQDSYGGT